MLAKKPSTKNKKTLAKKVIKIIKKPPVKAKEMKSEKLATKAIKKISKKPLAKKPIKIEKQPKKISAKEEKNSKKLENIKFIKEQKTKLVKTILSKTGEKKIEVQKDEVLNLLEKKNESSQKIILTKKAENRTKSNFKIGEYAIYPSHGIGKIIEIEKTEILGQDLSCYLMYFEKEKLNIKIPLNSAEKIGLRHLISKSQMDEVFIILRSGVKKLKGMWSRRAQEYETKINSGDIMLLAEVLRDLTRDIEDGERSYSERIIYETAIKRLASEYAAIYEIDFEEAKDKIIITAKDKLNSENKAAQRDEFDEFDAEIEDEEEDDEIEDEEEDDYDEDEDDDEKPRKKRKK
jgi:CarD family transcriptional regulator